jgi:hypothetical protein
VSCSGVALVLVLTLCLSKFRVAGFEFVYFEPPGGSVRWFMSRYSQKAAVLHFWEGMASAQFNKLARFILHDSFRFAVAYDLPFTSSAFCDHHSSLHLHVSYTLCIFPFSALSSTFRRLRQPPLCDYGIGSSTPSS